MDLGTFFATLCGTLIGGLITLVGLRHSEIEQGKRQARSLSLEMAMAEWRDAKDHAEKLAASAKEAKVNEKIIVAPLDIYVVQKVLLVDAVHSGRITEATALAEVARIAAVMDSYRSSLQFDSANPGQQKHAHPESAHR